MGGHGHQRGSTKVFRTEDTATAAPRYEGPGDVWDSHAGELVEAAGKSSDICQLTHEKLTKC